MHLHVDFCGVRARIVINEFVLSIVKFGSLIRNRSLEKFINDKKSGNFKTAVDGPSGLFANVFFNSYYTARKCLIVLGFRCKFVIRPGVTVLVKYQSVLLHSFYTVFCF